MGLWLMLSGIGGAWANVNGVAVIIGNRTYENERVPPVAYAHRDAQAMRRYALDVLKFDPANVIDLRDAGQAEMVATFGNAADHRGKLWQLLDPQGRSDVVVFYSGHGVPGLRSKRGYLLPVDADPDAAELNGYPIDQLYANLAKLSEARSLTVFLDACFSGDSHQGMLVQSASPVFIRSEAEVPTQSLTVLSAASGTQVASWDENAGHGLFTHHLLDALYGKADANGDGRITARETKAYLDAHMTRAARRSYGRLQNASLAGNGASVLAAAGSGGFQSRPTLAAPPVVRATPDAQPTDPANLLPVRTEYVTTKPASVRAEPSLSSAELTSLARLVRVDIRGRLPDKNWFVVRLADGRQGYLPVAFVGDTGRSLGLVVEQALSVPGGAPMPADRINLDADRTLEDWAVEADYRRDTGALLVEALRYRRQFGDLRDVLGVLDSSISNELDDMAAATEGDPTAALKRLRGIEELVGPRPPVLRFKARLLHGTNDIAGAIAAYEMWLGATGPRHGRRPEVLAGLSRAKAGKEPVREPGEVFRDCPGCPDMVVVPAGRFRMGADSNPTAAPARDVTIEAPFAVGRFEVTFAQWDTCVIAGACPNRPNDGGWGGERRPAMNLAWDELAAFVEWLRELTGKPYRLLSEAEWEYAARAGSTARYAWGEALVVGRANCDGCGSQWDNRQTAPVGSFRANQFGLYDLHGNVGEWVEDCWHQNYAGAPADRSARTDGDCSARIFRGGAWNDPVEALALSHRAASLTMLKGQDTVGFRLARDLD